MTAQIQLPIIPIKLPLPRSYVINYFQSTSDTLAQLQSTWFQFVNYSVIPDLTKQFVVHEIHAFGLFFCGFPPLFALFLFSRNSNHFFHRLAFTGIFLYWSLLPIVIRPDSSWIIWLFVPLCWLFAHKTILWAITDFELFRYALIERHQHDIIRQYWEFSKLMGQVRIGIPQDWKAMYAEELQGNQRNVSAQKAKVNAKLPTEHSNLRQRKAARTSQSSSSSPHSVSKADPIASIDNAHRFYSLPKSSPSYKLTLIRFILCTLLTYFLPQIPTTSFSSTLFTVRSAKTDFLLVNMFWLYTNTGWDLVYLIHRFIAQTFIRMWIRFRPKSPLFVTPAKEGTVAWYLQDFYNMTTSWVPMFGNIYEFRNVTMLWSNIWHKMFNAVFVDLVYVRFTKRYPSKLGKNVGKFLVFLISGLLHEYMLFMNTNLNNIRFEHTLFFVLQLGFMFLESYLPRHVLFPPSSKPLSVRYKLLRYTVAFVESVLMLGLMGLFWAPILRFDVQKVRVVFYEIIDWERIDTNKMIPTLVEKWLESDGLFSF